MKWALTKVFHETDDAAEDAILDGPNDYGIDAILEIPEGEINVLQKVYPARQLYILS